MIKRMSQKLLSVITEMDVYVIVSDSGLKTVFCKIAKKVQP